MTRDRESIPPGNPLSSLQKGLEALYRLDPAPAVASFLLARVAPATASAHSPAGRREVLYIVQGEDLQMGLLIDPDAIAHLHDSHLADENLEPFALVVEGISHFLFVVHRARQSQPTSALELELQAEVDKYVAAIMLARRCPALPSERLRQRLYEGFALLEGLSGDEQQRYRRANGLAQRYARRLERYVRRQDLAAMLAELRRFYRMPYAAKQDFIAKAA